MTDFKTVIKPFKRGLSLKEQSAEAQKLVETFADHDFNKTERENYIDSLGSAIHSSLSPKAHRILADEFNAQTMHIMRANKVVIAYSDALSVHSYRSSSKNMIKVTNQLLDGMDNALNDKSLNLETGYNQRGTNPTNCFFKIVQGITHLKNDDTLYKAADIISRQAKHAQNPYDLEKFINISYAFENTNAYPDYLDGLSVHLRNLDPQMINHAHGSGGFGGTFNCYDGISSRLRSYFWQNDEEVTLKNVSLGPQSLHGERPVFFKETGVFNLTLLGLHTDEDPDSERSNTFNRTEILDIMLQNEDSIERTKALQWLVTRQPKIANN